MSVTTTHATLAANALKSAQMFRHLGDESAADLSMASVRHHAETARVNANPRSTADTDAVALASKCAADAAGGGRAWRTPGSGSSSVAMAKARLQNIHERATRHGHPAASTGRRHAAVPLAGTRTPAGGGRHAPTSSGIRSRLFESRWS